MIIIVIYWERRAKCLCKGTGGSGTGGRIVGVHITAAIQHDDEPVRGSRHWNQKEALQLVGLRKPIPQSPREVFPLHSRRRPQNPPQGLRDEWIMLIKNSDMKPSLLVIRLWYAFSVSDNVRRRRARHGSGAVYEAASGQSLRQLPQGRRVLEQGTQLCCKCSSLAFNMIRICVWSSFDVVVVIALLDRYTCFHFVLAWVYVFLPFLFIY